MLGILPLMILAADYVGTTTYVEPVTQRETVGFVVKQDDRSLLIGCDRRGSGEVSIVIQPNYDEQPQTALLGYSQYRFGKMPKAKSAPWDAYGEVLRYNDMKLGASKEKAKFLDALANDTVFHIRFDTDDGKVSATFEYGSKGAPELWKMLQECRPAKVMAELSKMGSILAQPTAPANHGSKISQ